MKKLQLIDDNKKVLSTMPILDGTMGPSVIDVTKLYTEAGYFTYDPGFMSTASCNSDITYIDGEKGILLYRGYRIEELAEKSSFLEVCQLLLDGELPGTRDHASFVDSITQHSMVNEQLRNFYGGFRRDAHPMAIMVGVVGALSAFYHDSLDIRDPRQRMIASHRLIAKMPTIAAMAHKYTIGQPFMYPKNSLNYVENFLHMLFGVPAEEYHVNPITARALEKIFILHADHEQNASTSTVRMAGSSGANPFACIASGIACLWGPAHGGANEEVLKMLHEIGNKKNIPQFLEQVRKKERRLMGFGHRVYKNYDPRAAVLRSNAHEVLETVKANRELFDLALELERIALEDPYFVERKLFPNVDFYSGVILSAIGIPTNMFTVLFALARTVGWIAQWQEMMGETQVPIARPRQLYTGHTERPYVPMTKR